MIAVHLCSKRVGACILCALSEEQIYVLLRLRRKMCSSWRTLTWAASLRLKLSTTTVVSSRAGTVSRYVHSGDACDTPANVLKSGNLSLMDCIKARSALHVCHSFCQVQVLHMSTDLGAIARGCCLIICVIMHVLFARFLVCKVLFLLRFWCTAAVHKPMLRYCRTCPGHSWCKVCINSWMPALFFKTSHAPGLPIAELADVKAPHSMPGPLLHAGHRRRRDSANAHSFPVR